MSTIFPSTRLGFHYFPDFVHYRQADINTWLPELKSLKVGWLTLLASPTRAIPEYFIGALIAAKIQPILHFPLSLLNPPQPDEIGLLFDNYKRWGVQFITLFDRPNTRQAWSVAAWSKANLVERFLDLYLPLAERVVQSGLIPVFPPLEPGGNYWDTAFLQAALTALQRRQQHKILERIVIGAYAWSSNLPINWGAGGPERWPESVPYQKDPTAQDQRGFRIFDWYQVIAQSVIGRPVPIFLLRAGSRLGDNNHPHKLPVNLAAHTQINLMLAKLASAQSSKDIPPGLEPLPRTVLGCNFWLWSTSPLSPYKEHAWFQPDGGHLPIVDAIHNWLAGISTPSIKTSDLIHTGQVLSHYLLLPSYEWGVSDWHLEAIKGFVKKYQPTVGFSLEEAKAAKRVTIVGEYENFDENIADDLIQAGCIVEQVHGSGIELASKLSNL